MRNCAAHSRSPSIRSRDRLREICVEIHLLAMARISLHTNISAAQAHHQGVCVYVCKCARACIYIHAYAELGAERKIQLIHHRLQIVCVCGAAIYDCD